MANFKEKLIRLYKPIGVGLVGAGYMGSGTFNIVHRVEGMEVIALYDPDSSLAQKLVQDHNRPHSILRQSIESLCSDPGVEVVVDGTCDPFIGAEAGYFAAKNGKHLVSINIEADVTAGSILKKLFQEQGCIYTVTAGDEPGELKTFFDHYTTLGFRVVACGKGKNNPLNVEATPDEVRSKLPDNGITAEQVASFVDGSKTMFEMACLSNATGLIPDMRGMHGPEAKLSEMTSLFRSQEKGGILHQEGVVDYVTGTELSGGIFTIVSTENERIRSDFAYLKIGKGPYYLFYQRYHNWFVDLPLSIAQIVLERSPTIVPLDTPTSQVIAVAKRDLKKGEKLDGIGGFTTYGTIERAEIAESENAIPLGIAKGMVMKREVPQGALIRRDDVETEQKSLLIELLEKPSLL